MKKFIIVIQNEYGNVEIVTTLAPNRQSLYNSDRTPSTLLKDKMIKDVYVFGGYNKEQISKCKVIYVEELNNLVQI